MDEKFFIQLLQQGQHTAFKMLVEQYSDNIFAICFKFLLHKQDAQDMTQEVFLEVAQNIHSFRGGAKLKTWMYRIAVCKCIDEIRRRKRKNFWLLWKKYMHFDTLLQPLLGTDAPDNQLMLEDMYQQLQRVLNELPDSQRIAFTLSKIEGFSYLEVAAVMNVSVMAVESLVYRAKKYLILHQKNFKF